MKFAPVTNSVVFDFRYGRYTISIADYISNDSIHIPEGKISVMILKGSDQLSSKTVDRLARYVDQRVKGTVTANDSMIDINLEEDDQFMNHLMAGMRLLLHN
jgi:hypothetical protein